MTEAHKRTAEQTERMGTEGIARLLFEFGLPATIGIIVNALYNIVDSIFVGHGVGADGIAATSVAFPIMLIMMAFGMLVGGGGNALLAIRLGEKKFHEGEKILGNALFLLIILSVVIGALGLTFLEPILKFAGATPEIMTFCKQYVGILLLGFLPQAVGFGLNSLIRTTGKPNRAMGTMFVGAIINTILNYLFVFVFEWGIAGSAWATVIGQTVSAATVIQYFLSSKSPINLKLAAMKPNWDIIKSMIPLGISSFFMQSAGAAVTVVYNRELVKYGMFDPVGSDGALAAIGVVFKTSQFFVMPVMGIVMGAQPLIGYNYGAMKFDRVKKAFKVATAWATIFLFVIYAIVMLFPNAIISVFGLSDPAIVLFSRYGIHADFIVIFVVGFQMLGANYFQSTGQAAKSVFLSLSRQVLFLAPTLVLFPLFLPKLFPGVTSLESILWAAPFADICATVITATLMKREFGHLDKKHMRQQTRDPEDPAFIPVEL